jgi:thioredoxin reductase
VPKSIFETSVRSGRKDARERLRFWTGGSAIRPGRHSPVARRAGPCHSAVNVTEHLDVAIVGAGPYGLSVAAHLQERGISFRIFGSPMHSWRERMPANMMLKSEGFASNIDDPSGHFTLRSFCEEMHLPYEDVGLPVHISTLISYGLAFQRRVVPGVEDKTVEELDRSDEGFVIRLSDGETVTARRVVMAVGMMHFQHVPPVLAGLPPALLSHSSALNDGRRFKGQDVTVVGAGASGTDVAALLSDCGAQVCIVVRGHKIHFARPARSDRDRTLWERIRYPICGIGFGWRGRFYTDAPLLFRHLPEPVRLRIVRTYLGPAGGPYMKERIFGRIPQLLNYQVERAVDCGGRVRLSLAGRDGSTREFTTSHVIAATGYRVDIHRLSFLSQGLRSAIRVEGQFPAVSAYFESSVPNLYFVGLTSASSFGPMMRFMFGAGFTARRLSRHLGEVVARGALARLAAQPVQ